MRFIALAHEDIGFGIGASRVRPGAQRVADEVRSEIVEMAKDGTLSAICLRWYLYPDNQVLTNYYLGEARRRNRYLIAAHVPPGEFAGSVRLANASAANLAREAESATSGQERFPGQHEP